MKNKSVLLISFHNQKALGVRYLEKVLKNSGHSVNVVFFKGFNSVNPYAATQTELNLLKNLVNELNPVIIGLSVMSTLYLETVHSANETLRENFNIPILWGGVYATLFPQECLNHADFVIRGEGEIATTELVDSIINNTSYENIQNLAYIKNGESIINDVRPLCTNLDEYGYPDTGGNNKYLINNDTISYEDPQLNAITYELAASRGCPFVCSYCSNVNIKRLYKDKGQYVRFRSVDNVMAELNEAKEKMPKLKTVHFWDEIFSDDPDWIDEFVERYKKEINLPFQIWGHPLKINKDVIQKLVNVGLYKMVVGIQSGSPRIRKEIFHRVEKQEQIINSTKILSECKVPQVIYDFMLRHPFENEQDIKETYELCLQLKPPFELQLHGLNFLPGTDIVEKAINYNLFTKQELNKIMYSSMQEQYDIYWGYENQNIMSNFWYSLIFMTQFRFIKPLTKYLAKKCNSTFHIKTTLALHKTLKPFTKLNHYYKKAGILLKSKKLSLK